jgi:hypothetical protein
MVHDDNTESRCSNGEAVEQAGNCKVTRQLATFIAHATNS